MITVLSLIGIISLLIMSLILILVFFMILDYLERGNKSFMCKIFKKLFHKKRKNNTKNRYNHIKRENLSPKLNTGGIPPHSEKLDQSGHY